VSQWGGVVIAGTLCTVEEFMKPVLTLSIVISFLMITPGLPAADNNGALEGYLREALAANPELAAQFDLVKASRQIGAQVGALADPKLSYTEYVTSVETRTGPQERALVLSQAFPWPGKLTLRKDIANEQAQTAFYRYEALQRQAVRQTGLAFYDYAFLGEATKVTSENLKLLQRLVPSVEEKVRGGGDLSISLRLEVELTRVEDQLQALKEQRGALSSRIESTLGRTPSLEKLLPFPGLQTRVAPIRPSDSLEANTRAHPLIVAAKSGVLSAELAEQLSRKSPLPDINIGANAIDIGDGGDTALGITIGVSIPLQFGKYRAERAEKEAMTSAARANVESVEQQLIADLHRSIQTWREADKRLDLFREKLLPIAEQALEGTEESFRNDKASLTDLIDAERTLLDLQLMNQRALAAAHKAALEIRVLTEPLSISHQ